MRIPFFLVAFASACASSTVQADMWSPSGNWQMSGWAMVSKGLTAQCPMTIDFAVPSPGSTASATPSFFGPHCFFFMERPYLAELQPDGTTLTLHDVVMVGISSGGCSGDLSGQWDNVAKTLTIDTIVPTDTPGTDDCFIQAVLTLNSPSAGSIVP
ncbi:hypothetical protein [Pelagerythrobacter marensis]|uniref:hypothetical protein n=1 Tax=Pelagerythrobacter marensis TaxID=543877 RepID=UPI00064988B3|nr:hypothetical protein [Pelagerythrobacter marensis]